VITTILAIAVVAPTAYLVELRFQRLRSTVEFLTILPFVIPPIILAWAVQRVRHQFSGQPAQFGLGAGPSLWRYFVLTLPFVFRAIDNALRAVDVKMLSEASASLGASPTRTFLQVIVPSISLGLVSGALLAFTTAMGEFTLAALLGYPTFPVYLLTSTVTRRI